MKGMDLTNEEPEGDLTFQGHTARTQVSWLSSLAQKTPQEWWSLFSYDIVLFQASFKMPNLRSNESPKPNSYKFHKSSQKQKMWQISENPLAAPGLQLHLRAFPPWEGKCNCSGDHNNHNNTELPFLNGAGEFNKLWDFFETQHPYTFKKDISSTVNYGSAVVKEFACSGAWVWSQGWEITRRKGYQIQYSSLEIPWTV